MNDKYLKIIIDIFLKNEKKDVLIISNFINETGIDSKRIINYLSKNGWKEVQLGAWIKY